jgi:hypothetical protein
MESPVREVPTPTMGAPPPVALVADWLLTPLDDPELVPVVEPLVEPDAVEGELLRPPPRLSPPEVGPLLPMPELPIPELPSPELVGELTVEFPCPGEAIEAAEPSPPELPGSPARGWPKKPLTVVLASF